MRSILILCLVLLPTIVLGQDKIEGAVSAEVFNYFAWAAGAIITGLSTAMVFLWRSKASGLTMDQVAILKKIHDDLLPLVGKLENEQEGRRDDIERLMGEQKDVFVKGLELTAGLTPLMESLKALLERVERLLRTQES